MKTVTLWYDVCAQRVEMAQREVERLKEQLASGQSATTGSCHPAEGTSRVRLMCIGLWNTCFLIFSNMLWCFCGSFPRDYPSINNTSSAVMFLFCFLLLFFFRFCGWWPCQILLPLLNKETQPLRKWKCSISCYLIITAEVKFSHFSAVWILSTLRRLWFTSRPLTFSLLLTSSVTFFFSPLPLTLSLSRLLLALSGEERGFALPAGGRLAG